MSSLSQTEREELDRTREIFRRFSDTYHGPDGRPDLRKVLNIANFPVHLLTNRSLGYRLWGLNVGSAAGEDRLSQIANVTANFVFPNPVAPTHVVIVSNTGREAHSGYSESAFNNLTLLPVLKGLMVSFLPAKYRAAFAQHDRQFREREVERLWNEDLSEALMNATFVDVLPQFRIVQREQPVRFALAYRDSEKARVVAGSIGLSDSEALTVLASLSPLQANDSQINTFNDERAMALEVMGQGQWV